MITKLLMKWFGPSFILKHRTTIMMFVAGLFHYLPIPVPDELKTNISSGLADLAVLIGTYLIAAKLDAKPITKSEIIKIEDVKK